MAGDLRSGGTAGSESCAEQTFGRVGRRGQRPAPNTGGRRRGRRAAPNRPSVGWDGGVRDPRRTLAEDGGVRDPRPANGAGGGRGLETRAQLRRGIGRVARLATNHGLGRWGWRGGSLGRSAGGAWADDMAAVTANLGGDESAFSVARWFCDCGRRDSPPLASF